MVPRLQATRLGYSRRTHPIDFSASFNSSIRCLGLCRPASLPETTTLLNETRTRTLHSTSLLPSPTEKKRAPISSGVKWGVSPLLGRPPVAIGGSRPHHALISLFLHHVAKSSHSCTSCTHLRQRDSLQGRRTCRSRAYRGPSARPALLQRVLLHVRR